MADSHHDLFTLLEQKLSQTQLLLAKCDFLIEKGVNGAMKLKRKVEAEIKFLQRLKGNPQKLRLDHVRSTNLTHLKALCDVAATERGVVAVIAPFQGPDNARSILPVDIVADGGATWIKVVARSPKALHMAWSGEAGYQERSIVEQGRYYVSLSSNNPYLYRPPKVVFIFCAGTSQQIMDDLRRRFGIEARGSVVPVDEQWKMDGNSSSDTDEEEGIHGESFEAAKLTKETSCSNGGRRDSSNSTRPKESSSSIGPKNEPSNSIGLKNELSNSIGPKNEPSNSIHLESDPSNSTGLRKSSSSTESVNSWNAPPLNLDITALIAYVSNLTNDGGAEYHYLEPLLDEQASWERQRPALPQLKELMDNGRRLICCETAYHSFLTILNTVGGDMEKKRSTSLLQKVNIVKDHISDRASKMHCGGKIKERSRAIFGSGDYYHAITLTANRGFVHAAANQGVRFAVILHESRALSEQKQQHAVPLSGKEESAVCGL